MCFGMPVMMRVPDVVGVRLTGRLRPGVLATDLALTVTERLRRIDLADRFVEFFGPGVSALSAGDRAVVANMAPEFGGQFRPLPDRRRRRCAICAAPGGRRRRSGSSRTMPAARASGSIRRAAPRYTETMELDLGDVEVSLAGPRRPAGPDPRQGDRRGPGSAAAGTIRRTAGRGAGRRGGRRRRRSPAAPTPRIRASSSPPASWPARPARLGLAAAGLGEDLAGTGIADGGALPCAAPACWRISKPSASASSAMAAPPASAIPGR